MLSPLAPRHNLFPFASSSLCKQPGVDSRAHGETEGAAGERKQNSVRNTQPHRITLQTRRNSSESEIFNVLAIFSIFTSETFRSPRSMPPMYVRAKPHSSANA